MAEIVDMLRSEQGRIRADLERMCGAKEAIDEAIEKTRRRKEAVDAMLATYEDADVIDDLAAERDAERVLPKFLKEKRAAAPDPGKANSQNEPPALSDDPIDTSDIPEADEAFFESARLRGPVVTPPPERSIPRMTPQALAPRTPTKFAPPPRLKDGVHVDVRDFEHNGRLAKLVVKEWRIAAKLYAALGKGAIPFSLLADAAFQGDRRGPAFNAASWLLDVVPILSVKLAPLGLKITLVPKLGYAMNEIML